MPPVPALRTPRLLLRRFEESDEGWLTGILSDPEVRRLTLQEALPPQQAAMVARIQGLAQRRHAYWVIEFEGTACGFICLGLMTAQFGPRGVYAGFELRRSFWNRGIATEALQAVIEFVFAYYELREIRATVVQGNAASVRVLEKAGLKRGGDCVLPGGKPGTWFVLDNPMAPKRRNWRDQARYFWRLWRLA